MQKMNECIHFAWYVDCLSLWCQQLTKNRLNFKDEILLYITLELLIIFTFSLSLLYALRSLAKRIQLVDVPNARKNHSGAIPLVGGIAISITFLLYILFNPSSFTYPYHLCSAMVILLVVGVLDDKYDVDFKIRFAVQGGLALAMMIFADVKLHSLGDILGVGDIHLDWFGYIVTVFAVIGLINAFNMVDGIDGLLGGLSIVTFGAMGLLLAVEGHLNDAYICLVLIIIMLPYVLFNLGLLGRQRKIFMGDAGSMMIGFIVVWSLMCMSQIEGRVSIRPVTALWFVAIPLMDMAAIMIRRIRRGDSPFKPDREHLHHICQRLGLTSRQTLLAICFFASLCAGFGLYGEAQHISESIMFFSFLALFIIYALLLSYIWRVTAMLRSWFNLETNHIEVKTAPLNKSSQ